MRMTWKLCRVLGIDIGLHYSWVLIGLWILFALVAQFHISYPGWDSSSLWAASFLTGLLFFLCLIAHELAHAIVGNRRGVGVRSITLFALGGVAQADRESPNAASEFWIAIAGPAMSMALGMGCLLIGYGLGWQPWRQPATPAISIPVLLGLINVWLAVFNLLPAFPLDGGRVLRAGIWGVTQNAELSLRAAAQTSRVIAMALIGIGFVRFFVTGSAAWLWLALIGWFVFSAAGSIYAEARVAQALNGVTVRDIMPQNRRSADRNMNLQEFVLQYVVAGNGGACVLVTNEEGAPGVVTAREVNEVPHALWMYRTLGDIMRPIGDNQTVSPEAPITDALEQMRREGVAQLAVSADGHFEGIVSRVDVISFLRSRARNAAPAAPEDRPQDETGLEP